MNEKNRKLFINFILVAIVSFALLYIGVRIVLDNPITMQNILAYLGFSMFLGLVSSALSRMKPGIAYLVFILGILVGYIAMYRAFFSNLSGWEELSGLMSLFIWILIGLGVGLLAQFGYYLYNKFKKEH